MLGALIAAALFGVFGGIAWIVNQPEPPPEPEPVPQAAGFAAEIGDAWLTGRTTTLPVGVNVDPSFGRGQISDEERVALADQTLTWDRFVRHEPLTGRPIEIHYFALTGHPPRELAVTVELTSGGPVLAAAPSLQPVVLAAPGPERYDYNGQETSYGWDEDISRVAASWASAYATDDRVRLRELTGDLEDRVYVGLGGFTAEQTSVIGAISVPGSENVIVRVQTRFVSDNGWAANSEWDLLIADAGTASPKILAWGVAGDGAYLDAYENGVAGEVVTTTTVADGERPTPPGG